MTASEVRRSLRSIRGPLPIRLTDIDAVNRVFSDAFTERYRRDGMVGVRVPFLNPAVWRYAIEDARDGAMLWRNEDGEVIAFNVVHQSGLEGWMGPLAVRPEWQGTGLGKAIVATGMSWLESNGARVLGLETMPRTMDNIGFYSGLGFVPGRLTITLTLEACDNGVVLSLLGGLGAGDRREMLQSCHALTDSQCPGYDFTREIELTSTLALGDVVLLTDGGRLRGFALFHGAPLIEGRSREELRVLKLVLPDMADLDAMTTALCAAAERAGNKRVAIRVQGQYIDLYRRLIGRGARVRWSDLRMTVANYPEPTAATGVVLSNWEI